MAPETCSAPNPVSTSKQPQHLGWMLFKSKEERREVNARDTDQQAEPRSAGSVMLQGSQAEGQLMTLPFTARDKSRDAQRKRLGDLPGCPLEVIVAPGKCNPSTHLAGKETF